MPITHEQLFEKLERSRQDVVDGVQSLEDHLGFIANVFDGHLDFALETSEESAARMQGFLAALKAGNPVTITLVAEPITPDSLCAKCGHPKSAHCGGHDGDRCEECAKPNNQYWCFDFTPKRKS